MQELGDMLRQAREAKGVTLADAEESTRIRAHYLEGLEYGDEAALPARVYVEGFLRNYAVYLGLSPKEVMARYRAAHSEQEDETPSLRASIQPVGRSSPGRWFKLVTSLLLVALLVAAGLYLGSLLPPLTLDLPALGMPAVSLPGVDLPGLGLPSAPQPEATATATEAPQTPEPVISEAVTPTPLPTAEPTATRVPQIRVDVRITSSAWLRVSLDGVVAFEGLLAAGENRFWVARDKVDMLSGNAGGTEVSVDGVSRGPLGAPGQVVELTWTRQ